MNLSVNGNSGPPKVVHLPFGPRLEKDADPWPRASHTRWSSNSRLLQTVSMYHSDLLRLSVLLVTLKTSRTIIR